MKFYVECPIAGSISGEVEAESEDKALEALQEMHAADEASCEVEWEWMEPARHRTDAAPSEAAFEELGPAALGAWIAKCTLSKAHTSLAAEILGRVTAGRRCPGVVALLRGLLGRVDSPLVREGAIYGLSYHRDSAIDATLRRLAARGKALRVDVTEPSSGRYCTFPPWARHCAARRSPASFCCMLYISFACSQTCLLYTSDAADE